MRADPLSTTFMALADPTRRAILARLSEGSTTVKELAEPFDLSAPAITKHLHVLEQAGLIFRRREAQRRPAVLNVEPLREAMGWIAAYRHLWEESLDRLEQFLQSQSEPGEQP